MSQNMQSRGGKRGGGRGKDRGTKYYNSREQETEKKEFNPSEKLPSADIIDDDLDPNPMPIRRVMAKEVTTEGKDDHMSAHYMYSTGNFCTASYFAHSTSCYGDRGRTTRCEASWRLSLSSSLGFVLI